MLNVYCEIKEVPTCEISGFGDKEEIKKEILSVLSRESNVKYFYQDPEMTGLDKGFYESYDTMFLEKIELNINEAINLGQLEVKKTIRFFDTNQQFEIIVQAIPAGVNQWNALMKEVESTIPLFARLWHLVKNPWIAIKK